MKCDKCHCTISEDEMGCYDDTGLCSECYGEYLEATRSKHPDEK